MISKFLQQQEFYNSVVKTQKEHKASGRACAAPTVLSLETRDKLLGKEERRESMATASRIEGDGEFGTWL